MLAFFLCVWHRYGHSRRITITTSWSNRRVKRRLASHQPLAERTTYPFFCECRLLKWARKMFAEGYWMCQAIHMDTHEWIEWIGGRQIFFSISKVLLLSFAIQFLRTSKRTQTHTRSHNRIYLRSIYPARWDWPFCVLTAQCSGKRASNMRRSQFKRNLLVSMWCAAVVVVGGIDRY